MSKSSDKTTENEVQLHPPNPPTVDAAWTFLQTHANATTESSPASIKAIRRKIDYHIVPLMFACYTLQFLDKVILNYAAVMGLQKDLALHSNQFSNIATFLFVGLLCFEIPNIYFLQALPPAKWLASNVICWGIATACAAAAHNYTTLLVARIFLGIFEATIGPSLLLISAQWYTKSEQAPRFAFWYCGLGIGQILGGAISYGFQHVGPRESLSGWRVMFVVLGCVTVAAAWLDTGEKVVLLRHVGANRTGVQSRVFQPRQILEALGDVQVYLIVLAVILLSVSSGVVTTYSATLIRNLGYKPKQAALMNMPSGVVSIFFTLLVGFGIRKQSNRWFWIICCIVPAMLGGALMSFLPIKNKHGCLAGIYLVNAVVAPLSVFYAWTAANISGSTKRAFTAAIVSGSFSIGNIIGPQTFQARDAPNYRPAKIAVLGTQAGCGLVTIVLYGYYRWQNGKRDRMGLGVGVGNEGTEKELWGGKTDKEDEGFRYCY
ncbi:major facilitator superfamily transporter [Phaeosphaeriaceae sp. PMI808]|nr:major facilitator superfamily transporter [Phaeosphaeriaceae sp. PMI808]